MRLDGYGRVLNVDFEEEVIERMKVGVGIEGVEDYSKMDILDMKDIESNSKDIIIDKSTLDALYSGKGDKDEYNVEKYFNEALRVVKTGTGQIVIISLLQSHILKKILSFFLLNEKETNSYHEGSITEVKIHEIFTKSRTSKLEQQFIGHRVPFFVTIKRTEFDSSNQQMKNFKTNFEKMVTINGNLLSHEDAKKEVLITQMLNLQYGNIKELIQGRIIEINLESASSVNHKEFARFKLVLVDSMIEDTLKKNDCAILIVPQGKETFPVYSTESGYRRLSESVGHARLIVVHLKSGNVFESFDSVKKELESTIMRFAQKSYTNEIPYVSEGKDIGRRTMIGRKYKVINSEEQKFDEDALDEYEYQDQYIIEDLLGEGEEQDYVLREVKFKSRLGEIQSDIKIRKKKVKHGKDYSGLVKVRSPLWKTSDDEFLYFEHTFLNSEYLAAMVAGLATYYPMIEDPSRKEKKLYFLVLGTGAGIFPMFLYKTMHPIISRLNTIDIDETIVNIGKDYFGFTPEASKNFRSEISDAGDYLKNTALPGKTNALFIDIASSEANESFIPPKFALEDEFFNNIHRVLNPDHHVVLYNTCCYQESDRHEINKIMNKQFKYVAYTKCNDASNRVYILSNSHSPCLTKSADNTVKHFIKTFCDTKVADSHDWGKLMNMSSLLEDIKYDQGNKAEVEIEHIEPTGQKKKKPKKK
jgi:spermidine synthase